MFENINGTEHAITAGNSQSNDRNNRQPMKQERKDFTSGVVGVGVNKQGSFDDPSMDILDDVDDVSVLFKDVQSSCSSVVGEEGYMVSAIGNSWP